MGYISTSVSTTFSQFFFLLRRKKRKLLLSGAPIPMSSCSCMELTKHWYPKLAGCMWPQCSECFRLLLWSQAGSKEGFAHVYGMCTEACLNFVHRHASAQMSCMPAEPFPHKPVLEEELLQTCRAAEIFGFVICGGRKSLSTVAYSFGGSKNCQFWCPKSICPHTLWCCCDSLFSAGGTNSPLQALA